MDVREDCDSRDRADFVWESCNGRELKSSEIVVLKNEDDDVMACDPRQNLSHLFSVYR